MFANEKENIVYIKMEQYRSVVTLEDRIAILEQDIKMLQSHGTKHDDLLKSSFNVCRIHVHTRIFDWCQPPNKNKTGSGTGTGFVLNNIQSENDDKIYIITAHHVVANAITVRVNFTKSTSELIDATIEGCNPVMDVALLSISSNTTFKSEIEGLSQGNSDAVQPLCKVTAMGFALGRPHMQTTAGVVSGRISNPSRLQVDVAVNPGNSGGPLLNENYHVIGIVVSGITDAQGINYAAPIYEASVMVKRMLSPERPRIGPTLTASGAVLDVIPSLNCAFTKSNKTLNYISSTESSLHGIYCASIHYKVEYPQSINEAIDNLAEHKHFEKEIQQLQSLDVQYDEFTKQSWKRIISKLDSSQKISLLSGIRNKTLKTGDIVRKMTIRGESYPIDMDMNCKFNFWTDKLSFVTIFDRLSIGEEVIFEVWRPSECETKKDCVQDITMKVTHDYNVFRDIYPDTEYVNYLSLCGVFVMSLLTNHIPLFKNEHLTSLIRTPTAPQKSFLIITHILPESPFTESHSIGAGDILVAINNTPVESLSDISRLWKKISSKENYAITLHMRDGSLSSVTSQEIDECNRSILEKYSSEFLKYQT